MSMNMYMHPRNIYKSPPNFKQLAIAYPEFRKHVKQDITGKVTLDFKDINALRALSCTLLKKDFNLDVQIPETKLIPTIPLRLNYLLWLEDLLTISGHGDTVKGIDIGCGASCVYPLIAAKKFGWKMIGTEVNAESLTCAADNVKRNSLENSISLLGVSGDTLLEEVFAKYPDEKFDFCMCNPPFYSSPQELHPFFKSRKAGRPHPRNAFVASVGEVVSDGGEVKFITKLINESKMHPDKIRIYSTMIGHKSSLPALKKLLRDVEVFSFKESEFCQGHTTRWGLAWTFDNIDLRKIPPSLAECSKKNKPKPPMKFVVPNNNAENYKLDVVIKCVLEIFNKLQINFELIKKTKTYASYKLTAYSNTWSHQRRKKRLLKRLTSIQDQTQVSNSVPQADMKDISNSNVSDSGCSSETRNSSTDSIEMEIQSSPKRDVNNGSCEGIETTNVTSPSVKRLLDEVEDASPVQLTSFKKMKIEDCNSNLKDFCVKGIIVIHAEDSDISIEVNTVENHSEREHLHQILQYIKNNLKLES